MNDFDPYVVLGLSPASGPADWKRAYRRQAMRWHPDRNDHPEATERFKQIRAAYDRLMGEEVPEDEAAPDTAAGDATDTAGDSARAEQPRAADIRLNLTLDLREAASGCRKTLHYRRSATCPTCEGSGESGIAKTRFCGACHGSGRVHNVERQLVSCGDCAGRGFFSERICPDCTGSGRQTTEVSLEVSVPAGMLAGDELRLAGQGEVGDTRVLPGDLFLTIIIATHSLFSLQGRDLCYRMPVSALTLLAGGELQLVGLHGTITATLAPGAIEERVLQLEGGGYPGRGKQQAGKLVVTLYPVFPQALNGRQRKLMQQLDAALHQDAEAALPELYAWRRSQGLD